MAKGRRRVVVGIEVACLAATVAFVVYLLVNPALLERVWSMALPRDSGAPGPSSGPEVQDGAAGNPPAILTVPVQKMYPVFLDQYRMRPDRRVLMAFETLPRRWARSRGDAAPGRFAAGPVRADGGKVVIPLLREGAAFREAVLPVPATFAQVRAALDDWAAAMDGAGAPRLPAADGAAAAVSGLEEAVRLIDTVDPRYVISGLTALDRLWRAGERDARILRAAARGYATLVLVLHPDEMGFADPVAAEALAFLALSRRADPALDLAREEGLLAMAMGYRAHAAEILARVSPGRRTSADRVLEAYLRQDLPSLILRAEEPDSGVLGPYLLARHYREIGLSLEAKAAARKLLEAWPTLYPSAVEIIHSGDIGEIKVLTILYPHEITEQVGKLVDPAALKRLVAWLARVKDIADRRVMPFSEFEGLLNAWKPYGDDNAVRFIVDAERVKGVFRSLYADAVQFRFTLLFDSWSVGEEARAYAESLAATDNAHPLVMLMRGRVAANGGAPDAAELLFEKVLSTDGIGGLPAYSAYRGLSRPLAKCRLLPAAVARMDGRPENLLLAGWLLADACNYDLAARFYAAGLAFDPYAFWAYANFVRVRGTDAPMRAALERSPNSYNLLQAAGECLAGKSDTASRAAAERAFAAAQALAPSAGSLAWKRAQVLRDLGRHGEAIRVLDAWIERYGDDGLKTIIMNARRAEIYLKMGRPREALQVLGNDAESMQGNALAAAAETHEALGDFAASWDYHRRAVERYPTTGPTLAGAAAFLWRRGEHQKAAKLIAQGRPTQLPSGDWYFREFMSALGEAPQDNIVRAVAALAENGTPPVEILGLARRLHGAGRSNVAFDLAAGLRAPSGLDIELAVVAYGILREWKGREAASGYLRTRVPAGRRALLVLDLYRWGRYDEILDEAGDPASYGPKHEEFVWLQKLLAWRALDGRPAGLADTFDAHFRAPGSDKYRSIGRYVLGMISRDQLLDLARSSKDRCEIAYYIGFSERLKGNFGEATQWYRLCMETLQHRNGEVHWAGDELLLWAHIGMENRHRLVTDDVRDYEKARARDVSGQSLM